MVIFSSFASVGRDMSAQSKRCGKQHEGGDMKFHLFDLFTLLYCRHPCHLSPALK